VARRTSGSKKNSKLKESRFDIFLSYNSQDKSTVREIYKDLRQRGLRPWLDEEELVPGRPWQEGLEAVIGTIRAASVLVGQGGLGPWEWTCALE
jgi:nucleotide-binding universal stress UspA family protein